MAFVLQLLAVLAVLGGLAAAVAHGGYLAMLGAAAKQRVGGAPISDYVRGRLPIAAATLGVALLALLLSLGGPVSDVLAIVAGSGSAVLGYQALQDTRTRYRSGG
jgi:hypothetical protein